MSDLFTTTSATKWSENTARGSKYVPIAASVFGFAPPTDDPLDTLHSLYGSTVITRQIPSIAVVVPPPITPPPTPVITRAEIRENALVSNNCDFIFTWNPSPTATSYNYRIFDTINVVLIAVGSTSNPFFNLNTTLSISQQFSNFQFRVSAQNAAGTSAITLTSGVLMWNFSNYPPAPVSSVVVPSLQYTIRNNGDFGFGALFQRTTTVSQTFAVTLPTVPLSFSFSMNDADPFIYIYDSGAADAGDFTSSFTWSAGDTFSVVTGTPTPTVVSLYQNGVFLTTQPWSGALGQKPSFGIEAYAGGGTPSTTTPVTVTFSNP